MDNHENMSVFKLFLTILKINTFTFGGGYTIIPVLRDEFSSKNKLIQEDDITEIVAIAQSSPGPMAVTASSLVGYRLMGIKGLFAAILASVLPCLVIISILYYIYDSISDNQWVKSAFSVMSGMISGILLVTTIRMVRATLRRHPIFSSMMMLASFIVGLLTNLNTGFIILISALVGFAVFTAFEEAKVK